MTALATGGLNAALTSLEDEGVPFLAAAAPEEQLALLPLPPSVAERRRAERPFGGRPPGAINKATRAWRDYLLGKYRSPLEVLAETYSRPVRELSRELGCTELEAVQVQLQAAGQLAPYLHAKMPTEVQLEGDGGRLLAINLNIGGEVTVADASVDEADQP